MIALVQALFAGVCRDLLIAGRRVYAVLLPLVFFVIVTSLFPLGVGPEPALLRALAPGVLWVAALLATLLSLNRLFAEDYADGTLELLVLSPHPLSVLVVAKVAAHWLVTGLPLVLLSPLLAISLNLPERALPILIASLLLGTPVLSLIGAIGAALTIGVRGGGVLISVLVLPLYTPVLIFGAGAVAQAAVGHSAEAYLSVLAAFLALAVTLAPWATAAAVKVSLD
ncbi:MAG TPA: heme exporter protein CcmB [Burkholderiales bacterium]|nr:heme exporter protein CcmB [Burkholderiales bacterium]